MAVPTQSRPEAGAARPGRGQPRVEIAAVSDRGRVREDNEDAALVQDPRTPAAAARGALCVVADGMGGHAAGRVAAHIAVQTVRTAYYGSTNPSISEALREAIEAANTAIYEQAQRQPDQTGMGCTLTGAVIHGNEAVVGHVGDSRAYLVRGPTVEQITGDHSWVAEQVARGVLTPAQAHNHPQAHVITRALGDKPVVAVDLFTRRLQPGDVLVLCSDGLTEGVQDQEIGHFAQRLAPAAAARRLVALANQRGGSDNVTVGVVRYGRGWGAGLLAARSWWPFVAGAAAILLAIVLLFPLGARPTAVRIDELPVPSRSRDAVAPPSGELDTSDQLVVAGSSEESCDAWHTPTFPSKLIEDNVYLRQKPRLSRDDESHPLDREIEVEVLRECRGERPSNGPDNEWANVRVRQGTWLGFEGYIYRRYLQDLPSTPVPTETPLPVAVAPPSDPSGAARGIAPAPAPRAPQSASQPAPAAPRQAPAPSAPARQPASQPAPVAPRQAPAGPAPAAAAPPVPAQQAPALQPQAAPAAAPRAPARDPEQQKLIPTPAPPRP